MYVSVLAYSCPFNSRSRRSSSRHSHLDNFGGTLVFVYDCVIVFFLLLLSLGDRFSVTSVAHLWMRECLCFAIACHRDSAISLISSACMRASGPY